MKSSFRRLVATGAAALVLSGAGLLATTAPASAAPVQLPVKLPVNVCGNTVGPVDQLAPAMGNTCV